MRPVCRGDWQSAGEPCLHILVSPWVLAVWVHSGDKSHTVKLLLPGVCIAASTDTNVRSAGELRLMPGHTEGARVPPRMLLKGPDEAPLCRNLMDFRVYQPSGPEFPRGPLSRTKEKVCRQELWLKRRFHCGPNWAEVPRGSCILQALSMGRNLRGWGAEENKALSGSSGTIRSIQEEEPFMWSLSSTLSWQSRTTSGHLSKAKYLKVQAPFSGVRERRVS